MTGNVRDASRERISSIRRKGDAFIKKIIKAIIECSVICFAIMLIMHCRVISALITGDKMPESDKCPRKYCKH